MKFITEGFSNGKVYRIKSNIDGKERTFILNPYYFMYSKIQQIDEIELSEVKYDDFNKMFDEEKLKVIEGYKITVKSPIEIENDEIIGIWGLNRNYNKICFKDTVFKVFIENNINDAYKMEKSEYFSPINKFVRRIMFFQSKKRQRAIEYIKEKGWCMTGDEFLSKILMLKENGNTGKFLGKLVEEGVLILGQLGSRKIFIHPDIKDLVLEKEFSSTKKREVIVKGGQITNRWLPNKLKRHKAIDHIEEKGWVMRDDGSLYDILMVKDKGDIGKFLGKLVEEGVLILGQLGSRNIYIHNETKDIILEKNIGPTKKREVIVKGGKITNRWLPNKLKRQKAIDYIKKKKWTCLDDKTLQEILAIGKSNVSEFLGKLVKDGILKFGQLGSRKIFIHPNTKNLVLEKEETPTGIREVIVKDGKITGRWLPKGKKRQKGIEHIRTKGGVMLGDKLLKEILMLGEEGTNEFIGKLMKEGILKHGQLGNRKIFIHHNTKNLVFEKEESPTGIREVIVRNSQIVHRWLPREMKGQITIEYIKEKGWVRIGDEALREILVIGEKKVAKFLGKLVKDGTLKFGQLGNSKIFIHPDTKNLFLKNEESPTGIREVIVKEGQITGRWLPNEEKRQKAIDHIKKKGGVMLGDETLKEIMQFGDAGVKKLLGKLVKDGSLKFGQLGSRKIFIHPETKNLVLENEESPTGIREVIVKGGQITDRWQPNEVKRQKSTSKII